MENQPQWLYVIFGGFLLIDAVIGNIVVVAYFLFKRKCKRDYELLIVFIAIADLISSISNLVFEWSSYTFPPSTAHWCRTVCKYIKTIGDSADTFATYILVMMFCIRYRCMNNRIKKLKIAILSLAIYAVAYTVHAFVFYLNTNRGYCSVPTKEVTYINSIVVLGWFVRYLCPMACMIYFIYYIYKNTTLRTTTSTTEEIERDKRILKTLFWLAITFIVSVGPHEISNFFQNQSGGDSNNVSLVYFLSFIHSLQYLQNAIKVIIYLLYVKKFRLFCRNLCVHPK